MNVHNTIQKSATVLIIISQTNTRLGVGNLSIINMNEIESQIKGNLSEFEAGANRQAERASY